MIETMCKCGECKTCKRRVVDRRRYENNPLRREMIADRCERNRAAKRAIVEQYLVTHPCVDCGEADPIVLEFDHVRGEKASNISDLVVSGGLRKLMDEIAKCDVRCANCHRRATYMRRLKDAGLGRYSNPYETQSQRVSHASVV